jgi:hypothetical protein
MEPVNMTKAHAAPVNTSADQQGERTTQRGHLHDPARSSSQHDQDTRHSRS